MRSSLQAVSDRVHFPLNGRLYLPESWTEDTDRMNSAGIPRDDQAFKEKWGIALDLIDETCKDCEPEAIVTDSGYGYNKEFLAALDKRDLHFVAYTRGEITYWDTSITTYSTQKSRKRGRKPIYDQPKDIETKPRSAKDLV